MGKRISKSYINKSYVELLFKRFCETNGYKQAESYEDVGAYELNHAASPEGYIIYKIESESDGWISKPFGNNRHSASELCAMLQFQINAKG